METTVLNARAALAKEYHFEMSSRTNHTRRRRPNQMAGVSILMHTYTLPSYPFNENRNGIRSSRFVTHMIGIRSVNRIIWNQFGFAYKRMCTTYTHIRTYVLRSPTLSSITLK